MGIRLVVTWLVITVLFGTLALVSCSGGGAGGGSLPESVTILVTNGGNQPVVGATVYLIPVAAIDGTPFDGDDVLTGLSEDRDEPLEDAIAAGGAAFPQAVTDALGVAVVSGVPLGRYFWFVSPAAGDTENLPGGTGCGQSREAVTFLGTTVSVEVSSQPSPGALFVGSTTCVACHPAKANQKFHAHRLGFAVPGQFAALQDASRYPDYEANWNMFLQAATFSGGTKVYFSDFDPSRGFDKFKTSLSDPTPLGETLQVIAHLWKTAAGDFKITLENVINPGDPLSPRTLDVVLTYGGAVFKQRNLVAVPGRQGRYPLLQFQTQGDEARFDRTRKVFRDYHLDFFWNPATSTLKDPPISKTFEGNCTGCHSTGFVRFQDPATLEWLSDAVNDPAGVFDIDGDGNDDEINTGCEVCHGPGAEHVTWAANAPSVEASGRFIVVPSYLSPSREMMICGRCHDRPEGNGPVVNEEPLNPAGEMPPPGISRKDYLASYVTRKGPASGNYWSDALHSKSHHQQYADLLKSHMHRNDDEIVTCTSCHDSHGDGPFQHHLTSDPDDPNSPLCVTCHAIDHFSHMLTNTGATHAGNQTTCVRCHMTKAAKTGSGTFGILLGTPTGGPGDPAITYFRNDITSHLFRAVPHKTHPDVTGVLPGSAMPIPYTQSCGAPCHDPSQLQFGSPVIQEGPSGIHTAPPEPLLEPDGYGGSRTGR